MRPSTAEFQRADRMSGPTGRLEMSEHPQSPRRKFLSQVRYWAGPDLPGMEDVTRNWS